MQVDCFSKPPYRQSQLGGIQLSGVTQRVVLESLVPDRNVDDIRVHGFFKDSERAWQEYQEFRLDPVLAPIAELPEVCKRLVLLMERERAFGVADRDSFEKLAFVLRT
jgi:hypothetical protein